VVATLVSLLIVAGIIWQDRIHPCNDGDRYTSSKPQPYPFNRRWCGWPPLLLKVTSILSLVALGSLMGSWPRAVMLLTLPGAWFVATHPTCVDAPAMLLGLVASLIFPTHPYAAVFLSCLAGYIHERGPVFAALYAWHPLLLVGLVAVGWWRSPAPTDKDKLVGRGLLHSIKSHRPYVDWLDMRVHALSLRGLWLAMAYCGCSVRALATVGVALASRLIGTDGCRFMFWAAPVVIREMPDVPLWFVLAHVLTFRRAI
jgi:hypothetical protein